MRVNLVGAASSVAMVMAALLTGGFATAAVAGETTTQADTSRRVCRSVMLSGTRLTRRVCRTQAEWDASRDRTQESVLRQQVSEQTNTEQQGPR